MPAAATATTPPSPDNPSLDLLDGFETVDRTPNDDPKPVDAPPPGDGPPADVPPVDTSTQPVTIKGGTVKVSKKRTASIKVSCPAISPGNCSGSLALRTAKRVTLAGLRAVLQLGSKRYNIAPGASTALRVKLASGSRRLAGRKGRLQVLAIASTGPSGRLAQSTQRLTLALGTATNG